MKRLSITLPDHLYDQLMHTVPERGVSSFVAHVLEEALLDYKVEYTENPVKEFIRLREELPKVKAEDVTKLTEGR